MHPFSAQIAFGRCCDIVQLLGHCVLVYLITLKMSWGCCSSCCWMMRWWWWCWSWRWYVVRDTNCRRMCYSVVL